jgi:hypothetical protein
LVGTLSFAAIAAWAIFELQPSRGAFPGDAFAGFVLIVAGTTCACDFMAARSAATPAPAAIPTGTFLATLLAALLGVAGLERADYPPHLWWSTAAIGAGGLYLGRLRANAAAIPWMTAAAGIASLTAFALERRSDPAVGRIAVGLMLLYGVGGSLASFGASRPRDLAWVAAAANAAALGVAWWTRAPAPSWMPW